LVGFDGSCAQYGAVKVRRWEGEKVGWWDSEKVGWCEGEKMGRLEDEKMGNERIYLGSRTRRRPIGRDYAAAKDWEGRK
jgi:hypothetical protein